MSDRCLRPVLLGLAVLVVSCGGGGGGGGGGAALPISGSGNSASSGTASGSSASTVTAALLTGRITFDSVPSTGGALNYAATVIKPVRGAALDVVDAGGTVKASTVTDADGRYSVSIPTGTALAVRVRAQLLHSGADGAWDVTVRDNTQSNGLYGMQGGYFVATNAAVTQDLRAPSGWTNTSYGAERVAAPFALLDAVYTAQTKILSVAPGTSFPALRVFWSPNNRPAAGSISLGQIGSSYFTDETSSGGTKSIYILGSENVDTDEYDSTVVTHEWGHYYQAAFSRDDSPGGAHSLGELLDRRLAFSEGWGNAWSGIAQNTKIYSDSAGLQQAQGFAFDVSAPASKAAGWFSETTVQSVLWNLNANTGFASIQKAMTGLATTAAVTSIHAFAAAFQSVASSTEISALNGLLTAQGITPPSDAFAANEVNDGGLGAFALPLYTTVSVGTPQQVCVTNQADPNRDNNKLGTYAYLKLAVAQARNYTVSISGPATSDPDVTVYQRRIVGGAWNAKQGTESGTFPLAVGPVVWVINDYKESSANTCFTVTVN